LNTSGLSNGAAITIPADLAWNIAGILAKHGQIKRGYLGIRSQTVDVPTASQDALKRKQATGLLVMSVEKNSPASKGGLIVGDILVAIAGTPVLHHDELFARLNGEVVGKTTPVEILRGGQPQTMNIVIGERE
ncbi:MAG: S1C family serine protease, partial [Syntrophothermus sp.]